MKNRSKIQKNVNEAVPVCYIGVRQSDIIFTHNYFKKSIYIFSSNPASEPFSKRLNQNIDNKEILPYYIYQYYMEKYIQYNQTESEDVEVLADGIEYYLEEDKLARELMPGKYSHGKDSYYEVYVMQ